MVLLLQNINQGECENIDAQQGWGWYKQDEESVIALQPQQNGRGGLIWCNPKLEFGLRVVQI